MGAYFLLDEVFIIKVISIQYYVDLVWNIFIFFTRLLDYTKPMHAAISPGEFFIGHNK